MSADGVRRTAPKVVCLPELLAERTAELLDTFAATRPSEGVVYWFGIEGPQAAVVTTLVVPDAETSVGGIRTTEEANAEAVGVAVGTPLVLLGQAHSHPGCHVRHSPTDDRETFAAFEGALSVVVPWFGRYGLDLPVCGVHRFTGGRYREITPAHVAEHLVVLPGVRDLRTTGPSCRSNA